MGVITKKVSHTQSGNGTQLTLNFDQPEVCPHCGTTIDAKLAGIEMR